MLGIAVAGRYKTLKQTRGWKYFLNWLSETTKRPQFEFHVDIFSEEILLILITRCIVVCINVINSFRVFWSKIIIVLMQIDLCCVCTYKVFYFLLFL